MNIPFKTRKEFLAFFKAVRQRSMEIVAPLSQEDWRIQPIDAVSPPWWALGHPTWFFVKNILEELNVAVPSEFQAFDYPLNSYYEVHGERLARGDRGKVSRPTNDDIMRYRRWTDIEIQKIIKTLPEKRFREFALPLYIGMVHEEQHQELMLTEAKYILWSNAPELRPIYAAAERNRQCNAPKPQFLPFKGGTYEFGHTGEGFCWDNETPRHTYYNRDFALLNRLITNGEYLQFIEAGGYNNPLLWLSNGWAKVKNEDWKAPLYWQRNVDGEWTLFTLSGLQRLNLEEPVCHISFYEADAYARWRSEQGNDMNGCRLPTEHEWEQAAREGIFPSLTGNFYEDRFFHPQVGLDGELGLLQMEGDVWEWTSSHYEPYPGYRPYEGKLSEYNGKFMDNQRVLRGGSCATPRNHIRLTYRNFWPADTRFQFSGIRLAQDIS